jgi:hypothetical protein
MQDSEDAESSMENVQRERIRESGGKREKKSPAGAWMFLLCVLSKDKNEKFRKIKTKKQVRNTLPLCKL